MVLHTQPGLLFVGESLYIFSKLISEAAALRFKSLPALSFSQNDQREYIVAGQATQASCQRVLLAENPVTRQADILIAPRQVPWEAVIDREGRAPSRLLK